MTRKIKQNEMKQRQEVTTVLGSNETHEMSMPCTLERLLFPEFHLILLCMCYI